MLFFVYNKNGDFMNVFITGGASGIGYHLAKKLIKNGHYVFLGVHTLGEVSSVFEKISESGYSDRVSVIKFDVTSKVDRNKIKQLDIDCLVNQAGVGIGGSLINLDVRKIRENFEVNFFGILELVKLYIETRKGKSGRIVVTSSLAGIIPIPFLGSYCSTKSALISMFTCLRSEIKKTNFDLKIKLIEPGAYKTGFNQLMIDNKEVLDNSMFNDMQNIIDKQNKIFSFFEKKNLDSIVNKMYKAILSTDDRLVYRAPFSQVIGMKLYMLFFE